MQTVCNHKMACSTCGLTLRLLHHDKRCLQCQQELEDEEIIITSKDLNFEDFNICGKLGDHGARYDQELAVFIDDRDHLEELKQMQSAAHCPLVCGYQGVNDIGKLKKHVQSAHNKFFCN